MVEKSRGAIRQKPTKASEEIFPLRLAENCGYDLGASL
jgi:hypothetical protein